jgi:hypothetical protein
MSAAFPKIPIFKTRIKPASDASVNLDLTKETLCNFSDACGSVEGKMKMENAIRILAGMIMLISISLAHWVSQWLLLGAFAGVNLIPPAFTGFCPSENIFKKLGIGKGGGSCCR